MSQFKRGSFESKRHSFIRQALRSASIRWKPKTEAKNAARKARGLYECSSCKKCFGPKEIQIDHIEAVIDLYAGFTNWHDYALRLFCPAEGYQVLCVPCHSLKTGIEDKIRAKNEPKSEKSIDKKYAKR